MKYAMQRIAITLLLALLMIGCRAPKTTDENAVRQLCEDLIARYPAATLQDVYKTCYQDFFGAEHLMRDTAAARYYLHEELLSCQGLDLSAMPMNEPTGFRHRFTRVNLQCVLNGEMSEDELLRLFIEAAGQDNALNDNWENEWQTIEAIAIETHPAWQNDTLQQDLRTAAQLQRAVRHSDPFRNTYRPHYRIIRVK